MARTSRDIRSANRLTVVQQVVAAGTTSRQRLAADTGLSLGTVATLVGELTALGLLVEAGREDSGGGRPRGLVTANPHGGLLVGVDVAETYVHVDLFDTTLTRLAGAEETLHPLERRPHQVVRRIVSGVDTVLAGTDARVLGVGVSVPGQVDREGGVSVFAPNWDWHDVPLRDLLADGLALPLHLDNPLRAAVLAELWAGAARGRDDVAVINLGTGVGAGLAFGGVLYRGGSNSAGEWGHTTLVLDGRLCRCGSRGCVEAYVGAPGIMQTLRDLAPTSPLLHPEDQTATLDALAAGLAPTIPPPPRWSPRPPAISASPSPTWSTCSTRRSWCSAAGSPTDSATGCATRSAPSSPSTRCAARSPPPRSSAPPSPATPCLLLAWVAFAVPLPAIGETVSSTATVKATHSWAIRRQPEQLVNGSPVVIAVTPPVRLTALSAKWLEHDVFFSYDPAVKAWYGVAGVSLETHPGIYALELKGTTSKSAEVTFSNPSGSRRRSIPASR